MGIGWTTVAQETYLLSEASAFQEAQRTRPKQQALNVFWQRVYTTWFHNWPLEDGEDLEQKRNSIYNWFYWYVRSKGKNQSIVARNYIRKRIASGRKGILRPLQLYHKLYKAKIAPIVDRRIKKEKATTQSEKMSIRQKVLTEMWKDEDEKIKQEVDDAARELRDHMKPECLEPMGRSPQDYRSALLSLPSVLCEVLQPLCEDTGWVFFIGAGGPNPGSNGDIFFQNYYFGPRDTGGKDFKSAYAAFDANFQQPFVDHVSNCYPIDVRQSRAIINLATAARRAEQSTLIQATLPTPNTVQKAREKKISKTTIVLSSDTSDTETEDLAASDSDGGNEEFLSTKDFASDASTVTSKAVSGFASSSTLKGWLITQPAFGTLATTGPDVTDSQTSGVSLHPHTSQTSTVNSHMSSTRGGDSILITQTADVHRSQKASTPSSSAFEISQTTSTLGTTGEQPLSPSSSQSPLAIDCEPNVPPTSSNSRSPPSCNFPTSVGGGIIVQSSSDNDGITPQKLSTKSQSDPGGRPLTRTPTAKRGVPPQSAQRGSSVASRKRLQTDPIPPLPSTPGRELASQSATLGPKCLETAPTPLAPGTSSPSTPARQQSELDTSDSSQKGAPASENDQEFVHPSYSSSSARIAAPPQNHSPNRLGNNLTPRPDHGVRGSTIADVDYSLPGAAISSPLAKPPSPDASNSRKPKRSKAHPPRTTSATGSSAIPNRAVDPSLAAEELDGGPGKRKRKPAMNVNGEPVYVAPKKGSKRRRK